MFVALDREVQSMEEPLGGVVVRHQTLGDDDCFLGNAEGLGVQAEVDDQLFRGPGDAAEVGVGGDGVLVFDLDALTFLDGFGLLFFRPVWILVSVMT